MNKTWKKLLSLALMLCMLLSAVSALAGEEPVTLTFVCAYAPNYGMQDLIDDFEAQHPNIKIDLQVYNNSTDGNQAVDNMLMNGGLIDLQLAYGLDKTDARASSDFYTNLDEYVANWGINVQDTFGVDIKFRNSEGEQHYYGIPVDALQWYIAINMDEWKAAGYTDLPTAWTWDEYIEACRKMTHDGLIGGADVLDGGYNWVNHVRQVYGPDVWYNEEGYSAILSNPLFKESLQMKLDCESEGIWFSYPDSRQTGNTGVLPFMEHRVNSYVTCNIWRFIADTANYPIDFQVGFAPYPTREAGQTNYCDGPTVYGFMTITETCQHKDEAWEFVKYFATEGNYHILKAGHMGMYAEADRDQVVEYVFGSLEDAAKLIDVESFERVVLNFGGLTYVDTIIGMGGSTKVSTYEQEILAGNIGIDEGMAELEQVINQAIQEKMDELE